MKTLFTLLIALLLTSANAYARTTNYINRLCQNSPDVSCTKVEAGDTWQSLWPDSQERDAVMRLNRMNNELSSGMVIAVPKNLSEAGVTALQPFPAQIEAPGEKTIWVDLKNLAWAAYDPQGTRVYWGPASGARGYCPDMGAKCTTPTGTFTIYRKQGEDCVSSKFPLPDGGAPMPYCMYFKGGFALHGSYGEVPGYNASHGCVRIYPEDAQWLNENFIDVGSTKVIIEPH